MTPTNRLRFIERNLGYTKVRILQQYFAWDIQYPTGSGEWRDVPLETEE